MNKIQVICIIGGAAILGAIMYPINKRRYEEQKALKKAADMIKQAMEEEHQKRMKEIRERGEREIEEMREKHVQKMVDLYKKFDNLSAEFSELKRMPIKFKDVNGVIHEIEPGDYEGFRKMMKDKSTTIVFDRFEDLC